MNDLSESKRRYIELLLKNDKAKEEKIELTHLQLFLYKNKKINN